MKNKYPYEKCEVCKTIADCPHPDVEMDGLGTPMCPDECPKPIDVMRETLNERKKK